jgi:hypothetical protein
MSAPSQIVNFVPPAFATQTLSSLSSLSGSVNVLQQQATTLSVTGSFSAQSNYTYSMNLPFLAYNYLGTVPSAPYTGAGVTFATYTGTQTLITVTFPSSPADGDFITLIDSGRQWGNVFYNIIINASGKRLIGAASTGTANLGSNASSGQLFNYRLGTVTFVYNATIGAWAGVYQANTVPAPDDQFSGWWMFTTKNGMPPPAVPGVTPPYYPYAYIDATQHPVFVKFYGGTYEDPSDLQSTDTSINGNYTVMPPRFFLTGVNGGSNNILLSVRNYGPKYGGFTSLYPVPNAIPFPSPWNVSASRPGQAFGCSPYFMINSYGQLVYNLMNADINVVGQFSNPGLAQLSFLGEKMSQPPAALNNTNLHWTKQAGTNGAMDYQYGDFNGPVNMFKAMSAASYLQGIASMNVNVDQDGNYIGDYYKLKDSITTWLTSGITFNSPIYAMQKTYTGSYLNVPGSVVPTGPRTDISTSWATHYCTPGSNVTISGLTGAWGALNGYYSNGVSAYENCLFKADTAKSYCLDFQVTVSEGVTGATGSSAFFMNRFSLIKDTSNWTTYPGKTDPLVLGQADFSGPNASVSVTHRIYESMPYNEWIAAFQAWRMYAMGFQTHTRFRCYLSNLQNGQLYTNWNFTAPSSANNHTLRTRWYQYAQYAHTFGPPPSSVENFAYWHNDPYQSYKTMYQQLAYTQNNFTGVSSSFHGLTEQNYLETGSVAHLFQGIDGTGARDVYQELYSGILNLKNISDPSIRRGQYIVSKMMTGVFAGPGVPSASFPDTNTWILAGNTVGGTAIASNQYYLYAGIIRKDLTNGKTIGYMKIPDGGNCFDIADSIRLSSTNLLTTPSISNTSYTGSRGYLQACTTVVKYLTSQNCQGIILDSRNNGGGAFPYFIWACFGGDRKGVTFFTLKNDSGYSQPLSGNDPTYFPSPNNTQVAAANMIANILPSDVARNFPGGVFAGTGSGVDNSKKVVFLTSMFSASNGDTISRGWQGDNYDGNIGSNTYAKLIGNVDGRIIGGALYSSGMPTLSSNRLNSARTMAMQQDGCSTQYYFNATGTISNRRLWSTAFYPEFGVKAIATGATGTFTSTVPGVTALPDTHQTILWPDLGLVPSDGSRYIPQSRPLPTPLDSSTWRDTWLEQAIREACYPTL